MARVVIFGAGDIGRLARVYFTRDSEHEVAAFAVDPGFRRVDELLGLPVLDFDDACRRFPPDGHSMFIALSYGHMNQDRAGKCDMARQRGYNLVSYVSSRCTLLTDEPVGDNCFILEDNTIQPFVKIGRNVTMWSGNHIGHDSVIEDHCFITSHVVVSGHVRVGAYSFIGVNATLRNSISLAPRTLVGAGAVIMKDTIEKGVYLPQRAELFSKRSDEIEL
jgi:sugar O-acyltransferase (sialic acid O-acetyltransferase NeuD family)